MKMRWKACLMVAGPVLLLFGSVFADEVRLKNGDHLTGQIVRMEEGNLIFKTTYTGEISITWKEVAHITTDDSIEIVLDDETILRGSSEPTEGEKMKVHTEKLTGPVTFYLADVKAINPTPVKPFRVTARTNVSVTTESGNTDSDNVYVDGEFVARTEKSRYTVGLELSKEKSDGETTSQNALGYANYDYFFTEKWFLYATTLFEHDELADLDLRSTLGAGAAYQIFEGPSLNLSLGAGPAFVDENFIEAEDNNFGAGQWFVNYDQVFFDEFVQLFHRHSGVVSFENSSDWFIRTRTGLRFPLYRGFTATLQYNFDWDNDPSEDAETEEDTKFLFLLGYQYGN